MHKEFWYDTTGKRPLDRLRRWENNINMKLSEIGYENLNFI
jgi:hypothetical protein